MRSGLLEHHPLLMHRYRMEGRGWIGRHGFWPQELLWPPAGIVAPSDRSPGQEAAVRFRTDAVERLEAWLATEAMEVLSLAPLVPCGLPLTLGCRRLWRLGYRRGAWAAGVALGVVTLPAGLLGPLAIVVCAVALGPPAWISWWWLARRG